MNQIFKQALRTASLFLTLGLVGAALYIVGFWQIAQESVALAWSNYAALPIMLGIVGFTVAYAAFDKWSDSPLPFQFYPDHAAKLLTVRNPGGLLSIAVPLIEMTTVYVLSKPELVGGVYPGALNFATALLQYNLLAFGLMGGVIVMFTALGYEIDVACMDTRVNAMLNGKREACAHDRDCGAFSLLKLAAYVLLWAGVLSGVTHVWPWLSQVILSNWWLYGFPVIFVFWKMNIGRDAAGHKQHVISTLVGKVFGRSLGDVVGRFDDYLMGVEAPGSLLGALAYQMKPVLQRIAGH